MVKIKNADAQKIQMEKTNFSSSVVLRETGLM